MQHTPSLADKYQAGALRMETLHDGQALAAAASRIEGQLPAGAVTLLSTCSEGAAVAAVCAARRSAPTSWRQVHLGLSPTAVDGVAVFVEPVDPGLGWRTAVQRRYPDAMILFSETPPARILSAA